MKTKAVLAKARKLISDPAKWCQGAYAQTPDSNAVKYDSPKACSYCSLGAIALVAELDGEVAINRHPAVKALAGAIAAVNESKLNPDWRDDYIVCWNDDNDRTHAEVLAAFDKAIATYK